MRDRFQAQLRTQLGFLQRSSESFDAGFTDEALRIAVVVRTLVHGTSKSTSLLAHLGSTGIEILSLTTDVIAMFASGDPFYGGAKAPRFFNGAGMFAGGVFRPKLGDSAPGYFRPAESWWLQVLVILDHVQFTRKSIVLSAANQDGGAHVDAKLTADYVSLIAPGSVGSLVTTDANGIIVAEAPISDVHFVALRQMAYEVLHSPALLALADLH